VGLGGKHDPFFQAEPSQIVTKAILLVGVLVALALLPSNLPAFSFGGKNAEEKKLVIPDFDNVRDQYAYAVSMQQSMLPSTDKKRRRVQLDRLIQCYSKVVENFPEDKTFTPVAYVTVAECYMARGDERLAHSMFQQAMQKWSDNDYIVARCMLDIANAYDRSQRYSEAQKLYKEIMERFKDSKVPGVSDIIARARARYYTAKEEPTAPVKKSPFSFLKRLNPFRQ